MELLIVIAIMGILAAIIMVSINSARSRGTNTRVLSEIMQIRTQLEIGYGGGKYLDLISSVGHVATVVSANSGFDNLQTLLCDIGNQNSYIDTVSNDIEVTCNGISGLRSGVVIYSVDTGPSVTSYGIYSTTTPGGYICVDSYGNNVSTTTGKIPSYSSINSPSTALCQ